MPPCQGPHAGGEPIRTTAIASARQDRGHRRGGESRRRGVRGAHQLPRLSPGDAASGEIERLTGLDGRGVRALAEVVSELPEMDAPPAADPRPSDPRPSGLAPSVAPGCRLCQLFPAPALACKHSQGVLDVPSWSARGLCLERVTQRFQDLVAHAAGCIGLERVSGQPPYEDIPRDKVCLDLFKSREVAIPEEETIDRGAYSTTAVGKASLLEVPQASRTEDVSESVETIAPG